MNLRHLLAFLLFLAFAAPTTTHAATDDWGAYSLVPVGAKGFVLEAVESGIADGTRVSIDKSGLRPGQTRSLVIANFRLDAEIPTVTAPAQFNKRKKAHEQPVHSSLVAELREHFKNKAPAAAAFKMPDEYKLARMIRVGLELARQKWIDEAKEDDKEREVRRRSDCLANVNHDGKRAVFYSVRHGFGRALGDTGIPEKDTAAAVFHTSRETTERYLHADRKNVKRAVEAIASIQYSLWATGTDDCLRGGNILRGHWWAKQQRERKLQ